LGLAGPKAIQAVIYVFLSDPVPVFAIGMCIAYKTASGKTGRRKGCRMKGFLTVAAVLILIGFTLAVAAEKPTAAPPLPPRIPEMSTAGKVLEVSAAVLKIERTLKGKVEIMEFILEKPFPNLAAGDQIKVSYLEKDGRNVLIRVAPAQKTAVRKAVKKELPKEMKPVSPPAATVTK
jgi:hypothetical protein